MACGDLDGDGVGDLFAGSPEDADGGGHRGALWVVFMKADGTVKTQQKISATQGNFVGPLDADDQFGIGVAALVDLDGNGITDLITGASLDDDGGSAQGAAWVLFLEGDATPPTILHPPSVAVVQPKGSAPAGAFAFFTVTASDQCDPTPSLVCVPPSGSFFAYGITLVTCTATDASGNQTIRQFPVFVLPSVRPR